MSEVNLSERVVSLDLGFGYIKGKRQTRSFKQPSVLGVPRKIHEQDVKPDDIVLGKIDNTFDPEFFVGNLAVRHSNIRHYSKADDKPRTWTTELFLFAALSELADHNEDILLVTGLPIDFYFSQRDKFGQFFENWETKSPRPVKIGNNEPKIIKPNIVKSVITLQPMGAAMKYLLDQDGQFKDRSEAARINVVGDIGFHTFDLLVLDGMEIHRYSHSNKEISISTVYTLVQDWLKDQIGSAPDLYELDYHIRRGNYQGIDLTVPFMQAMGNLAQQAKLELESLNLKYNKYISTGGWAEIITPLMELPKSSTVIYNQDGNVDGYELIGARACRTV